MADTQSVVSDVKLFLERLKKEMPEIFGTQEKSAQTDGTAPAPATTNKVLYNGDLFEARTYLTPDQEAGVAFDGSIFHVYLPDENTDPSALVTQWLRDKAAEVRYNHAIIAEQQYFNMSLYMYHDAKLHLFYENTKK